MAENPLQCWAASGPTETENTRNGRVVSVNRGQIQLTVSYSSASNQAGQVAFAGGYPFRDGSTVTVNIGGEEFALVTVNDDNGTGWAFTKNQEEDNKLVAAMKRGVNAVVTGVSSRGTNTKDTFSLLGLTAAVDDAEKRCSG